MGNPFRRIGLLVAIFIAAGSAAWPCAADARLDDLLRRAQTGDHQAEFALGLAYELGEGVPQDYGQAANWYSKAAKAGYAPAIASLGYLHQVGKGVAQDSAAGAALHKQAAEAGDLRGQFFLAVAYTNGLGVPQDAREAARWYHAAAKAGDQQSQLILAMMLHKGIGVRQNEFAARRWFDFAAKGPNKEIAEKSSRLRASIDSKVLASGPFGLKDIDSLKAIGFGLLGLAVASAVACGDRCGPGGPTESEEYLDALQRHHTEMARDLWINTLTFGPD
jgi:hypothetical protein